MMIELYGIEVDEDELEAAVKEALSESYLHRHMEYRIVLDPEDGSISVEEWPTNDYCWKVGVIYLDTVCSEFYDIVGDYWYEGDSEDTLYNCGLDCNLVNAWLAAKEENPDLNFVSWLEDERPDDYDEIQQVAIHDAFDYSNVVADEFERIRRREERWRREKELEKEYYS